MSEAKFSKLIVDLAVAQSNMSILDEDRPRVLRAISGLKVAEEMYDHLIGLQSMIANAAESGSLTEELFLSNAKTSELLAKARGEK